MNGPWTKTANDFDSKHAMELLLKQLPPALKPLATFIDALKKLVLIQREFQADLDKRLKLLERDQQLLLQLLRDMRNTSLKDRDDKIDKFLAFQEGNELLDGYVDLEDVKAE